MNRRLCTRFFLALVAVITSTQVVSAGWHEFWHNVRLGYHRNNAWPQPFAEADAHDVVAPFEVMKNNGWQLHNTISHELFRQGDGELLASGNERVRWITNVAPAGRRGVYVMRGRTPEETEARLVSVRRSVERLAPEGQSPQIFVTDRQTGSSSGAWAVKVNREWLNNLAVPQLPSTSVSGASGATTASGGGSQ